MEKACFQCRMKESWMTRVEMKVKIDLHKADVVKHEVHCTDESDAYRDEWFVIFNEELFRRQARVTTEEV